MGFRCCQGCSLALHAMVINQQAKQERSRLPLSLPLSPSLPLSLPSSSPGGRTGYESWLRGSMSGKYQPLERMSWSHGSPVCVPAERTTDWGERQQENASHGRRFFVSSPCHGGPCVWGDVNHEHTSKGFVDAPACANTHVHVCMCACLLRFETEYVRQGENEAGY